MPSGAQDRLVAGIAAAATSDQPPGSPSEAADAKIRPSESTAAQPRPAEQATPDSGRSPTGVGVQGAVTAGRAVTKTVPAVVAAAHTALAAQPTDVTCAVPPSRLPW
jgi:hypothetical protein